jgi:hypothetical protein
MNTNFLLMSLLFFHGLQASDYNMQQSWKDFHEGIFMSRTFRSYISAEEIEQAKGDESSDVRYAHLQGYNPPTTFYALQQFHDNHRNEDRWKIIKGDEEFRCELDQILQSIKEYDEKKPEHFKDLKDITHQVTQGNGSWQEKYVQLFEQFRQYGLKRKEMRNKEGWGMYR